MTVPGPTSATLGLHSWKQHFARHLVETVVANSWPGKRPGKLARETGQGSWPGKLAREVVKGSGQGNCQGNCQGNWPPKLATEAGQGGGKGKWLGKLARETGQGGLPAPARATWITKKTTPKPTMMATQITTTAKGQLCMHQKSNTRRIRCGIS